MIPFYKKVSRFCSSLINRKKGLILIFIFVFSYFSRSVFFLFLLQAFPLQISKSLYLICWTGKLADLIRNLSFADLAKNYTCSNHKSKYEPVCGGPAWCLVFGYGLCICIVEEGKAKKLRNDGIFDWKEKSEPSTAGAMIPRA